MTVSQPTISILQHARTPLVGDFRASTPLVTPHSCPPPWWSHALVNPCRLQLALAHLALVRHLVAGFGELLVTSSNLSTTAAWRFDGENAWEPLQRAIFIGELHQQTFKSLKIVFQQPEDSTNPVSKPSASPLLGNHFFWRFCLMKFPSRVIHVANLDDMAVTKRDAKALAVQVPP